MDIELWKRRKKELNLTFEDLSERTGLSSRTLKYLFTGERKSATTVTEQAIERALGINENPLDNLSPEIKDIIEQIETLSDDEMDVLTKFIDLIVSKRK